MNELGQLQLIWIRRLSKETERIRTLNECNQLSFKDIEKYKNNLSEINSFCNYLINNKDWKMENLIENIEEIEEELFVYFYNTLSEFGLN